MIDDIKIINEILYKIWKILINDDFWYTRFNFKNEIYIAFDSIFLKDFQKRVITCYERKKKYFKII